MGRLILTDHSQDKQMAVDPDAQVQFDAINARLDAIEAAGSNGGASADELAFWANLAAAVRDGQSATIFPALNAVFAE